MDVVLYQKMNSLKRTVQDVISANDARKVGQTVGTVPRVKLASYAPATATGTQWGIGSATSKRHFISWEQQSRVRQKGLATKIDIYVANTTGLTNFYFEIWRPVGTVHKRIYSEDILSKVVGTVVNTIELATPVKVEEGDLIGYSLYGQTSTYSLICVTGANTISTYYVSDTDPTYNAYNWANAGTSNPYYVPIVVYGNSPDLITIGDSIIAGHPGNDSLIESLATWTNAFSQTIAYNVANAFNWTYQNMGIGGQTAVQVSARFANDVLPYYPSIVLLEGGVNDIAGGSTDQTAYINNMKSMIDGCVNAGIIPVVLKILPWTNGTTAQNQTRDTWNLALSNLVATYPTAILVDANSAVGQFRSGGDSGNLWDINPTYGDGSGIHYNASGYAQIASVVSKAIAAKWF